MGPALAWDVPEDFWMLWWRNHKFRELLIEAEVEPAGKGPAGKRFAAEFQRQVMDQMERYRRYPMRGPVALDLHFRATQRNPPAIHRTVKHTLDLLGAALPGSERAHRHSVLYRDDRQVKFLYADLDQSWARGEGSGASSGSISIAARRASDVIAVLGAAVRIDRYEWNNMDDEESPFCVPQIPEKPGPGWPLNLGPTCSPIERYLTDSLRFHHVMDVQEAILAHTDSRLFLALGSYLDDLYRGTESAQFADILEESRLGGRSLLLSDPLTVPLPGLPRAKGESQDFAQRVRLSLEGVQAHQPLLIPLLVPVTLTFLVIPPVQGKDLDNIALTVLPIAHEVLRPHISPHLLSPVYAGDEPDPQLDQALARLKSVNAESVCAYQVIELPRTPEDPPEGILRLALGQYAHWSWWRRAEIYVSSVIDRAEQSGTLDSRFWRSVFTGR